MIINGELNKYKVEWAGRGWSYAVPIVKEKKKVPFLPVSMWVGVWEGNAVGVVEAKKKLPDVTRQWYQRAVNEYEKYIGAWSEIDA